MSLEDYKNIIHRCFRCGYCKFTSDFSYLGFNCPLYNKYRFETYSPGGMLWLTYASLVRSEIEPSHHLTRILYSCTMCQNCVQQCNFKFHEYIVDMLKAAKEEIVDKYPELIPSTVVNFLTNIYEFGNPYRQSKKQRDKWAEGTQTKKYEKGDQYLFYVGCVGSYDPTGQDVAVALSQIFLKAGISFGILGNSEICDGNESNMLGEIGLFEFLRDKNSQTFRELEVKKIITLSPHSYNAFKNYYPDEFGIFHYTQILQDLIKKGRLEIANQNPKRVTYHDPCFLGRYNNEYESSRAILSAIPGIEYLEMDRNRENSFCCGGGGGNFYTDMLGPGINSPSRVRVREAYETGANILAVSCPICKLMLEEATKTEKLENDLLVKDISEIVYESL